VGRTFSSLKELEAFEAATQYLNFMFAAKECPSSNDLAPLVGWSAGGPGSSL